MIGKLIRMEQQACDLAQIKINVFALTRYVIDADPRELAELAHNQIMSLSDYALAVGGAGDEPGEKVEAFGAVNLEGDSLQQWQAQMVAVAARATQGSNLLDHIILSVRENELFTEDQRVEAIEITIRGLGLQNCPYLWAEHGDTKNPHLHIAALRVDRETGMVVGSAWPIDDLHQVLAIIEEKQGRQAEPKALYFAREGAVFDTDTGTLVRDSSGAFQSGWYIEKGVKHLRVPDELRNLAPSILAVAQTSQDWEAFHRALQPLGVHYDKKGSGARIAFGSCDATASNVDAALSRSKLTKKWGEFVADQSRVNDAFEKYQGTFRDMLADLRASRDRDCKALEDWSGAMMRTLPIGSPAIVMKALDAERGAATAALNAAYKAAIARHTKARLNVEQWRAAGRPVAPPPVERPALILPGPFDGREQAAATVEAFVSRQTDWRTQYFDDQGTLMLTDHRVAIVVAAPQNHDAIDVALKIAADRWGNIRIFGSDGFVALANQRAALLGIEVVNAPPPVARAPVPIAETAAPSPSGKAQRAVKSYAVPPDARRDARIDELISKASEREFLPMRRLMPSGCQGGPGEGLLEIVASEGRFWLNYERIAELCVHDDDPRVQAFLEHKYKKNLEGMERQLSRHSSETLKGSPTSMVSLMKTDNGMKASAALIQSDPEFLLMIDRVREHVKRRERAEAKMQADYEATAEAETYAVGKMSQERQTPNARAPETPMHAPESRDSQWVRERVPYGRDED